MVFVLIGSNGVQNVNGRFRPGDKYGMINIMAPTVTAIVEKLFRNVMALWARRTCLKLEGKVKLVGEKRKAPQRGSKAP